MRSGMSVVMGGSVMLMNGWTTCSSMGVLNFSCGVSNSLGVCHVIGVYFLWCSSVSFARVSLCTDASRPIGGLGNDVYVACVHPLQSRFLIHCFI